MDGSIFNVISEYRKSGIYPFCSPGHKQVFSVPKLKEPYAADISRAEGLDSIHHLTGVLGSLQEKLGYVYRCDKVLLSVNGGTSGMLAAVAATTGDIALARNCSKPAFDAVSLFRKRTHYIYPKEVIPGSGITGGVSPTEVEDILIKYPDTRTVIITSPTPEGFVSNVEEIARIAHEHDAILIVDESHGAHFNFDNSFPVSSVYLNADIVIQSLNRTLPCFNQTAIMLINREDLVGPMERAMSVFTTTSPSLLLLAGVEACIDWCLGNLDMFNKFSKRTTEIREELKKLQKFKLLGEDEIGNCDIFDYDQTKFLIYTDDLRGGDVYNYLLKNHLLQFESAGVRHVLGITTVCDREKGYARLLSALFNSQNAPRAERRELEEHEKIEIAKIFTAEIGEVYTDFIYMNPTAAPVLAPGEVMTLKKRNALVNAVEQGLEVVTWERFSF